MAADPRHSEAGPVPHDAKAGQAPLHAKTMRSRRARMFAGMLAAAAACLAPGLAQAQIGSYRYSSIVVDDATGKVTEAVNADAGRYPASLTKLMTLYMAFEAMRDHRITLNQQIPVSAHAAGMEPTKLGLLPGTRFSVEDAILGIITRSANDAACALGELIGGNEDRFAQMMTLRARALGMTRSTFRNASGLPDPEQITTARDLALLAHHLITDFPAEYHYFSVPSFYFHGHEIPNHDRMLTDYEGADGLKTGYTIAAGHNLVTSALRGGVRLIGVVMGASSNPERDIHMASLLDDGFTQLGVPITPHPVRHFRMPSLIETADAAPLRPRYTSLRGRHGVHGRVAALVVHRGAGLPHATLAVARGHNVVAAGSCRVHHHCALHSRRA